MQGREGAWIFSRMSDIWLFRCLAFFAACVAAVFLYAMLESALEISQEAIIVDSLSAAGLIMAGYVFFVIRKPRT